MQWESGSVSNPSLNDSVWLQTRGKESIIYALSEKPELKATLMSKCKFAPGLVGETIMLYDAPESMFTYNLPAGASDASTSMVKTPDSRMKKVMYFPINIQNFGTYAEGSVADGFKVYYPSAYFRIRMIYGVYGTFTYLWTEEVTKPVTQGGLDFPDQVETQGTTIISTPGIWEQMGSFNWVLLAVVIVIIGIVVLALIGPWIGIGGIMILQNLLRLCSPESLKLTLSFLLPPIFGASPG
jgi:hypothetical protein